MSSHHRQHDKEKERMREQAKRQRAMTAKSSTSESPPVPLFDEPSKVPGSSVIKKKMNNILGMNYEDFCQANTKAIGVVPTPPTPQPDSGRKKDSLFKHPTKTNNGAFREHKSGSHESSRRSLEGAGSKGGSSVEAGSKDESKSNKWDEAKTTHEHKRSRDHSADSSSTKSSEHRGHHSNHHRNRMPSDGGGTEGAGGGGGNRRSHSSDRTSHSKHSSNQQSAASSSSQSSRSISQSPVKPIFQSVQSPHKHHSRQSSSPSQVKTSNVSSPRKSLSPANNVNVFQQLALNTSPGSCNNSPANQISHIKPLESLNGIVSRGPLAKQQKNKLPKLLMPSFENNRGTAVGIEGLHDIFKEMKNISPPVSEINTPRKSEEKLTFHLSPKREKELNTQVNEVTVFAKPADEEKKLCAPSHRLAENTLKEDLNTSDDSETEQSSAEIQPGKPPIVIPIQKREVGASGMSSGSDSSSEGSDSSSDSDGETSSSEEEDEGANKLEKSEVKKEEEQLATPKETPSWGLGSFLKQLKRPSPEAPLPKKSNEKQKEIDETNDEMLDKVIQTAITSPHTLKEIGHTSSLPFPTDHLGSDQENERHQNGADSGCDIPGFNNTSMGSLGSPDTASTCSSTSSKPTSRKPEKKRGRPSLSSSSENVQRTSKSEFSDMVAKSNSSGASKIKSTPKKESKRDKSKSYHDERKRRKTDYKSKPTISDSDDSEIDVVSVTPDAKAGTLANNSIADEDKEKFRHKLFSSPKSNKSPGKVAVSRERESKYVSKDKGKDVKHKVSSHRKKDRDRDKDKNDYSFEKNRKKDQVKVLSPVPDCRLDIDSDKQVEDIIQNTSEFKPQCLLSPFSSPTKTQFHCPSPLAASPSRQGLTFLNGKPAIMVDINLSLLDKVPSSAISQSASPQTILKSSSSETENKSVNEDTKNPELYHKLTDITKKSVEKSQKTISYEKKMDTSDKSAKFVEKLGKSVDKSARNEQSASSNEKSASTVDKNMGVPIECKEEGASEDLKDIESQSGAILHDQSSRPHKRKSDSDRQDSNSSSSKRHKSSSKSNKKSTENLHNGSSSGPPVEESRVEGGSSKERRSSTSSTSSRHNTTTGTNNSSSSKSSKKFKVEEKLKKEPQSPDKSIKEKIDISQQNGQDHLPFTSYNEGTGVVKMENGPVSAPAGQHVEDRLESAEKYLSKAKELKHLADKDKPAKFSLYVKSVLSFVQCGCAMEKEAISESNKIFTMYQETLHLLKQVIRVRGTCIDPDVPITDKRLSVLLLRIQSLLCLKLYNLKKSEVMKFKKIIDADNNKSTSAKSPHQSTMYNRSIGTPPPISPTPSPAGSIGSVGSQGSCDLQSSKLTNGNLGSNSTAMSSPGTVSVSQRIHSVTQQYIHLTGYCVTCLDLWQQADIQAHEFKEFFNMLDNTCGPLSLHSSVLQLVRYVNEGLKMMKDT